MTGRPRNEIAVVVNANAQSGVKTIAFKLIQGLRQDGFEVKKFSLVGNNTISLLISDLRIIRQLGRFRTVIYIGSSPWLSHLVTKNRKLLFVHGFVSDELAATIRHGSVRAKMAAVLMKGDWFLVRKFDAIDAYACHSVTARERNKLPSQTIILPQFVLSGDLEVYSNLSKGSNQKPRNRLRIVTYRSHAESPRLLSWNELETLVTQLERDTREPFELVVVDPYPRPSPNNRMKIIPFLPKKEFLELIRSSGFYLERCKDEELGFGSLESGIMGTPVVKVTSSEFIGRGDYTGSQVISASSAGDLAEVIARFIDDGPITGTASLRIANFVASKRIWDRVKSPLIKWIEGKS
jgi:glycosyltransferase involved in cell wall biosynthesis